MAGKKILFISDMHSGSHVGLTHPSYHHRTASLEAARWGWDFYADAVSSNGPYDIVCFGGDAIDGKQHKDQAFGLWTSNPLEQLANAEKCINAVRMHCNKGVEFYAVTGTCYHVDIEGASAEHFLQDKCGFEAVKDRMTIETEGFAIDLVHDGPKGGTPNGVFQRSSNGLAEAQPADNCRAMAVSPIMSICLPVSICLSSKWCVPCKSEVGGLWVGKGPARALVYTQPILPKFAHVRKCGPSEPARGHLPAK